MHGADIAVIGLAVMGENLALNIADHGFSVAVFNRTSQRTDDFLRGRAQAQTRNIVGARSLKELVGQLSKPRKLLLMVKAGGPVDDVIGELAGLLEQGDIIVDGGNSHYLDTERRLQQLGERGILYVGCGISGGEEGALRGPSMMPGGAQAAWPHLKPIFQAIAAKADDGMPCCDWIGPAGSGHFVKMVHNGIEYGDMQTIGEAYHLLKGLLGLGADALASTFASWNQGELGSYLIEITSHIFKVKDQDGTPLVDKILDCAGQKGTGKWTVSAATDHQIPLTLIAEALFARNLSADKDKRLMGSQKLSPPTGLGSAPKLSVEEVGQGLLAAKIVSYAQGFDLIRAASHTAGWQLDPGSIARLWRGGCIIRSTFLDRISDAYKAEPDLSSLLYAPFFSTRLAAAGASWRKVIISAVTGGIPVPCFASSVAYYDGIRSAWLPTSLVQAQRDFFGAHMFERIDHPRGEFFHHQWTTSGGATASTPYTA